MTANPLMSYRSLSGPPISKIIWKEVCWNLWSAPKFPQFVGVGAGGPRRLFSDLIGSELENLPVQY